MLFNKICVGSLFVLVFIVANSHATEFRTAKEVQNELASRGFDPGAADGVWGQKSIQALKKYQRENGLEEKGTINKPTLEKLFPLVDTVSDTTKQSSRGTDQAGLKEKESSKNASSVRNEGFSIGKFLLFVGLFIAFVLWMNRKKTDSDRGDHGVTVAKVEPSLNVKTIRSKQKTSSRARNRSSSPQ